MSLLSQRLFHKKDRKVELCDIFSVKAKKVLTVFVFRKNNYFFPFVFPKLIIYLILTKEITKEICLSIFYFSKESNPDCLF